MGRGKPFLILLLVLLLAAMMLLPAIADAGNFSGNSDYGGSDWGGSDWGDSDWGGSDWGGSDWGGSDWSGSGSNWSLGGGGWSFGGAGFGVIIAVVIVYFLIQSARKKGSGGGMPSYSMPRHSLNPMSSLLESDPKFSERDMKERIANLYVRMQEAWESKRFEEMQPFMKDTLYAQFAMQLNELIRAGQTNRMEKIAVLSVSLNGWRQDEAVETIVATVNTRLIDYTVDDRTGTVVSGSKTAEKFMTYEWELSRSAGTKTPSSSDAPDEKEARRCPSCGAPLNLNQSAKCPYCDSVINTKDFDWVISAIRGISQRTA